MNLDTIEPEDIICIYDCCVFILREEPDGYIFRVITNEGLGATGHHETKELAVNDVLNKNCKVFINIKSI